MIEGRAAPDVATSSIVLVQGCLQYFCLGIIFSQATKFWERSAEDTIYLRLFVAALVVGGCLQTALSTYKVWVVAVADSHWWSNHLYDTDFFINGLVCAMCEAFLIMRCWKASGRNAWVLMALLPLAVLATVANIWLIVKAGLNIGHEPLYMDPLRTSVWAFQCWVWTSLVLDLAITVTLSILIWGSKTGYDHLDKTLRNIIGMLWESAAPPCIFMIIAVGLFFGARHSRYARHLDLFFILSTSKLYTLGLLRTLNCRKRFKERLHSRVTGRQSLGEWLSNEVTAVEEGQLQVDSAEGSSRTEQQALSDCQSTHRGRHSSAGPASPDLDMRERGIVVRTTKFVHVD